MLLYRQPVWERVRHCYREKSGNTVTTAIAVLPDKTRIVKDMEVSIAVIDSHRLTHIIVETGVAA